MVYKQEYMADHLMILKYNICNDRIHAQNKRLKWKHQNKAIEFWFTKTDLCVNSTGYLSNEEKDLSLIDWAMFDHLNIKMNNYYILSQVNIIFLNSIIA